MNTTITKDSTRTFRLGADLSVAFDRLSDASRLRERLAGVLRVSDPALRRRCGAHGMRVWPDEVPALEAHDRAYWDGPPEADEEDGRWFDISYHADRGDPPDGPWDGFVLTQREGVYWSGEYYVTDGLARISVALDEGDVMMLVDQYLVPFDAGEMGRYSPPLSEQIGRVDVASLFDLPEDWAW